MPWDGSSFQGNRQTELEWHIESRGAGTIPVKLHPRQVVDRVVALLNEFQDALQPPAAGRDFQHRPRLQTERADSGDVGEKEILKRRVVGNIQKN